MQITDFVLEKGHKFLGSNLGRTGGFKIQHVITAETEPKGDQASCHPTAHLAGPADSRKICQGLDNLQIPQT